MPYLLTLLAPLTSSCRCLAEMLVLSQAFVDTQSAMDELHLLLEHTTQDHEGWLLVLMYDMTSEELEARAEEYQAAEGDAVKEQWAKDLKELGQCERVRIIQVREWLALHYYTPIDCLSLLVIMQ
jgi:hypothetical protein